MSEQQFVKPYDNGLNGRKADVIELLECVVCHYDIDKDNINEAISEITALRTQNTELQRQVAEMAAVIAKKDLALSCVVSVNEYLDNPTVSDEHRQDKADAHHDSIAAAKEALAIQPSANVLELIGYCDEDFILMGNAVRSFTVSKKQHDENNTPLYRLKDK